MSAEKRKIQFTRRFLAHVVPHYSLSKFLLNYWIPDELLGPLGSYATYEQVSSLDLDNPAIGIACFDRIRKKITDDWEQLSAELAVLVVDAIDDFELWDLFDRSIFVVSRERRELLAVRWELADSLYLEKTRTLYAELEQLAVSIPDRRILGNFRETEPRLVTAMHQHVALRAQIDLAFLAVQKISRNHLIRERIKIRFDKCSRETFRLLRDILGNSTMWRSLSGRTYLGADEAPPDFQPDIQQQLEPRLAPYEAAVNSFMETLTTALPSRQLIEECAAFIRSADMNTQPISTTNFHFVNSQVGVLNTGTIQHVQSIDSNITTLKSKGDIEISDAFKELTDAVVTEKALSEAERTEYLEQIKFLSSEASKTDASKNTSVTKTVLKSLAGALSTAGALAAAWTKWGPVLMNHFGV